MIEKIASFTERKHVMALRDRIKQDLVTAMKAKDSAAKDGIRVILGEFARQEKKDLPDEQVIQILKKLLKSEREVMLQRGDETPSDFCRLIERYLPQMASEDEITAWIRENIDFSQFSNKMQAMGPIMKHFGSGADGNQVKTILQKL
jgi:uncharacterized protein